MGRQYDDTLSKIWPLSICLDEVPKYALCFLLDTIRLVARAPRRLDLDASTVVYSGLSIVKLRVLQTVSDGGGLGLHSIPSTVASAFTYFQPTNASGEADKKLHKNLTLLLPFSLSYPSPSPSTAQRLHSAS